MVEVSRINSRVGPPSDTGAPAGRMICG